MQKAIDILMNILFFILKITALVSDSGKRFAKKLLSSTVRLLLVLGIEATFCYWSFTFPQLPSVVYVGDFCPVNSKVYHTAYI